MRSVSATQSSVFIVTNTLAGGGAEKQLLITAKGLGSEGMDCRIFCLGAVGQAVRYKELIEECRASGVRLVSGDGSPASQVWVVARLCLAVMQSSSPILWTWGFRAELLRLLCPVLWPAHGILALRSASRTEALRRGLLLQMAFPLTWKYIANSRKGVAEIEAVQPGVQSKSAVIYNALEDAWLTAVPRERRKLPLTIVMLGNVRFYIKGYDRMLQVAARIRQSGLPARIVVAGVQVEGEVSLAEEIAQRGLGDIVSWCGGVSDVRGFLEAGDVFLMLSRYEGTPNALLEAMAMGLPCVCTDVGDVRGFAEQGAGIRVIGTDVVDEAVLAIRTFIESPEVMRRSGEMGQAFCRAHFNEREMIRKTVATISGVGGGGVPARSI